MVKLYLRILKICGFIFTLVFSISCSNLSSIKSLSELDSSENQFADQEAQLYSQSQDFFDELKRKGLLYRDKQVNAYIKRIGKKLTPDYLQKNFINFHLIKNPTPNAAALPNGDIYINTGLLTTVDNEDQLASILAHEIGHVVHRHSLKSKLNRSDTIISARIADMLLAGMGIGYITAASSLASFSREQEKEADLNGIETLYKAGYVPEQSAEEIRKFQELPGANSAVGSVYSTHPDNEDRINYLQEVAQRNYPHHKRSLSNSIEYDEIRRKIVELNVQISLNRYRFSQALYLLDQAEIYYKKQPEIDYYRGESYRLMAQYPHRAAEDEASLLGKSYVSDEFIAKYKKLSLDNIQKSRSHYESALSAKTDLAKAYRGMGLLELYENNKNAALKNLKHYIKLEKQPKDKIYISSLIKKIEK